MASVPKTGNGPHVPAAAPGIAQSRPVRALRWVMEIATVAMIAIYAILILLQVFFRYALNSSLTWSEELVMFILLWSVMIGSAIATDRGAHIALNPLDPHLSPRWRRIRAIAADACTVSFCGILLYYGVILMIRTQMMTSPAAGIPMMYVYAAMPVGAALIIVLSIVHAIAGTVHRSSEIDELT
jgi:TRAP-type C4-dicarboxylate transport system permease small subunit